MDEKKLTNKEILEELSNVLLREENLDENLVSLSTIVETYLEKRSVFSNRKASCCCKFDSLKSTERCYICNKNSVDNRYIEGIVFDSFDFDYRKNILKVELKLSDDSQKRVEFYYNKEEEDLQLISQDYDQFGSSILKKAGMDLLELAILYSKNKKYFESKYNCKTIGTNFLVDIHPDNIILKNGDFFVKRNLKYESNYGSAYEEACNSVTILYMLNECEEEIFHKLYVSIEDCPEWAQSVLRLKRKNQLLVNEKKLHQSKKYIKRKK